MQRVETGLERLLADPAVVGGRPWVLLSNQAAVTADLVPARAALTAAGVGRPLRLLAPEHGLDGTAQDMEAVGDAVDPLTGLPVCSLYGVSAATLAPRPGDLEGVAVVLVDLPDIGARHYTFAATMDAVMAAAGGAGLELVVLDRPNPLTGCYREGGLVRPGFASFVSQLPVPARHGLTLGELALLLQRERYPELELTVLPCRGWRRRTWWDATGLPWVPPSPNMPTLETAVLYPGLCLVEATTLSEGRGTTRPFHLVGAPFVDPAALAARLRAAGLAGLAFRPARFRPMFGKHAAEECGGVELHVTDRDALRPLAAGVALLAALHELWPENFAWRPEPYEFVSAVPAIDLLTGSAAARAVIEGRASLDELLRAWEQEVAEFEAGLDGVLLYHEEESSRGDEVMGAGRPPTR